MLLEYRQPLCRFGKQHGAVGRAEVVAAVMINQLLALIGATVFKALSKLKPITWRTASSLGAGKPAAWAACCIDCTIWAVESAKVPSQSKIRAL